ncbi:MAG: carboxypeptidase regulatory-like domain-containing protein, partial [Pyrinomonadaceae bacterium]
MKRERPTTSRGLLILACGFLLLLACGVAHAQSGTSSVRGTVTDPQHNVVAGATVTLTSTETNAARTQTTNESGAFSFELLPPGPYRLGVEAAGFKKAAVTDVQALISKPTELSVALEVGNVTETVTVAAGAGEVLLNTQDATIGHNFVAQQILQLPLEARNPVSLLTLQPGVTREGNVTGARSDQSNITLDGVDINEAQTNSIFAPVLRLNSEAIDEFRVVTTNANATEGRSSGAQIQLITKSGTNDWHATAFWSHRNTIFTANDFFSNRSGLKRPTLLRNTFGATLGGPIKRDRAFFFYSFEGRRDASQAAIGARTVPL